MTARTHDVFAFASLVTVATYFPPSSLSVYTLFASVVGNIIGALIPDMDGEGNRLWDLLPYGNSVAKYARLIFYKHRSITHSLLGLFLIYKALDWLLPRLFNSNFVDPNILLVSIMIGYISHLVADGFTEEGLPLLFPLNIKFGFPPIKKIRITTGSWFEKFVVFPGVGLYLFWFIHGNSDKLFSILQLVRK
jgi:inner membrane protein